MKLKIIKFHDILLNTIPQFLSRSKKVSRFSKNIKNLNLFRRKTLKRNQLKKGVVTHFSNNIKHKFESEHGTRTKMDCEFQKQNNVFCF